MIKMCFMVLILLLYSNFYRLFLIYHLLFIDCFFLSLSIFILFFFLINFPLDFLSQKPHLLHFSPFLYPQSFNYIPYFTVPSLQKENKELLTQLSFLCHFSAPKTDFFLKKSKLIGNNTNIPSTGEIHTMKCY